MEARPKARPDPRDIEALLAQTPYRVVRLLGQGRMGDVHEVEHEFLGRRFVLKVLRHASSPQDIDRMRVEAQTMARLRHPNVVDVVDFRFANDGTPYLVMELLQGRTLDAELVARGRLPRAEAVEFACQALSALGAAHEVGVVHRDVTPSNLYLHEPAGSDRVLKVLDFGLAGVRPERSSRAPMPLMDPTRKGARLGSPRFMAPEAVRGERVDHRADLFAVGLILYEMLAGHGPFDTGSSEPLPPSQLAPDVPPEMDAVVLRSIRDAACDRYQSADDFAEGLRPFIHPSGRGR
ncbi:MAG TPA: serine/threonine-protein kinase [Polyangiaceae bacterium]|nr:serine/threonine-protein kinase [Polyangiaceae bacterium]